MLESRNIITVLGREEVRTMSIKGCRPQGGVLSP